MKTNSRFCLRRMAWVLCSVMLYAFSLSAQLHVFTSTNPPATAQDFQFTTPAGVTNLAIRVGGNAATFSHLLLQTGTIFDDAGIHFTASLNGQTNAINLEIPEFKTTNYVLRVSTQSNSLEHGFTATVSTNVAGMRSAAFPATKPLASTNQGSLGSGGWHYYRVEIPASAPGWRVTLNAASNTGPDLYIQTNALPTVSSWLRRGVALTNDISIFSPSELASGAYFIGVNQAVSSNAYTLRTEIINAVTLNWDPGATHEGTEVYSSPDTNGGDYYFRITTANTSLGAWRTALNVVTGEAAIYLAKGSFPGPTNSLYKSERVGSDGFVVPGSAFSSGEDWYFMVRATPGSQWNLVSGEPFVTGLGTVAADGSSGSGELAVGAEGIRFFQTTMPVDGVAWRLWLNGATNTLMVRKSSLPLPGASDLTQARQMLVVPSYLVVGQLYFVGVSGAPGTIINLDSRQQAITDIPFSSTTNLVLNGYAYATFRVQVPADQLAWQVNVSPSAGNPNIAVRRNFVPNENNNEAYSEIASNVTDSITLVPPTLSDGTFFITVYSTNSYSCTLRSGNPEFTEINYTSTTVNADTNRVGWRFFKVSNISQQLATLGWDLLVTNFAPGTRIALRRNAAPGIWNFRNPNNNTSGTYDFLSAADFLQRPGHQADVWYVGVYNNNAPLGAFALITRELTAETVAMDGGATSRSAVPHDKWQFFRVDVPAGALGWDIRLTNVTSGLPRVIVRRELLPESLDDIGFSSTVTESNWPSGDQWMAKEDWTERNLSTNGLVNETGRILTMGMGRPLQPATYYVGVIAGEDSMEPLNYTLLSRGIGPGFAIPVQDIEFAGGSATNEALPARDIAVYRVAIPTNTPSWKLRLEVTSGDALFALSKERIPNITATSGGGVTNHTTAGKKMMTAGNEHHVQLPPRGQSNLFSGYYYLVVASEGLVEAEDETRIGTGSTSYILQSLGTLPEVNLGFLGTTDLVHSAQLEGGEVAALHFTTDPYPLTLGFELSLNERLGNPVMVSRATFALPDPGAPSTGGGGVAADFYGNDGGETDFLQASGGFITASGAYDDETVMLMARSQSGLYPDASTTLRVRKLYAAPMAFDGGTNTVVNQTNIYEFFRVDVPEEALGWDVRLINVLAGSPQLIICKDFLPLNIVTSGWNPGEDTYWPSGANWISGEDWTQRSTSSDGSKDESGRILAMGMGQPLEPGTYYVGIRNPNFPQPASYTVISRGIGDSFMIPVVDVPFAGGNVTNNGLAAREAAYYRVVVPPDAPSWRAKLTTLSGEAMFVLLTNFVPNVETGLSGNAGRRNSKSNNELFVRLPVSPLTSVAAWTNYFAVISEGVTNAVYPGRIGSGSSSFVLESLGTLPVTDLGMVGTTDIVHTATLEGADVDAYQFNVPPGIKSLELELQNKTGNPVMVVRAGAPVPNPGAGSSISGAGSVSAETYGNEGGYTITAANGNANSTLITLPNPTNGVHTLTVKARGFNNVYSNANYTLVIRAISYTEVAFDGGSAVVTNHAANTWRYYRVDVPEGALGWDVRIGNVTAGLPKLVVRRDLLPKSLITTPWTSPGTAITWPSTNQWGAEADWTRRTSSATAVNEENRILAMGMGQPLEPGVYYVGVINSQGTNAMSYTLTSRGIGAGLTIPVTDLNYTGGSATVTNLPPRQAAYFRVQVPTGSAGWKVKLSATIGESMLVVLSNAIPNVDSGWLSGGRNGKYMQKAGDEHYLLLPPANQTNLAGLGGGTYFIAVIGEGVNPATDSQVGTGASSFTITSIGDMPVVNLGTVTPVALVSTQAVEGGESRLYQFTVPPGAQAIELRLEDRVGNPMMAVVTNATAPDPGGGPNPKDPYGNEGGSTPFDVQPIIMTLANPTNGVHTLAVKARESANSYPNASYTLRVRQTLAPELNFTPEFNTNGLSNVAAGQLLDKQRAYYKVVVPASVHGQEVLGWTLDLAQSSGSAALRVRRDALPSDFVTGMPNTPNAATIAAPFLTNGTWYVEVRATNSTSYTLTSSKLNLQRPVWQMPGLGEPSMTPGLTSPNFGDSGVDTNGIPLPGDGGVDLELGRYHFYAVNVPTNNAGLLRVQLEAISGNPDIFIRTALPPTATHATNGNSGSMFERTLASAATEYGNFVPLDGTSELNLKPGLWYFAIRAVANANARYRLKLSVGDVQDLALDGGSALNQALVAGDWRYYRIQVPQDVPATWTLNFSQVAGDVVMYVRDVIPPGNGRTVAAAEYRDWESDDKNTGPYSDYDAPGAYAFGVPPVRPGNAYYLGFRAKNDAVFSVGSSISGPTNPVLPVIEFYGGSVTNVIPPHTLIAYRILTPTNGLRWRHTSTHSNTVQVYMENGTTPTRTTADDFRSTAANSGKDIYLVSYPWLPAQTFYMVATNTTAIPQNFSFTMNGSSNTADDDNDGLPDAWEIQYFGILGRPPYADTDQDGVINVDEYNEGTNPNNKNSYRPRLYLLSTNGIVLASPSSNSYSLGDVVSLIPVPNPGFNFLGWSGAATGADNPLLLTMNTNKTLVPRFRIPGDDFEQRIVLVGSSAAYSHTNIAATKQPGEPNHGGNSGGKSLWWTWTAPVSGTATVTTAGSDFRTALAAYTGSSVSNLAVVANHLAPAGTNTTQIAFAAVEGTTYQLAVDGFDGATGRAVLNLTLPAGEITIGNVMRGVDGFFRLTITGPAGQMLTIAASTNLASWTTVATVTNVTGTLVFVDTQSPEFAQRYYRVSLSDGEPLALLISAPRKLGNGPLSFDITGDTGQVLRVEASTNLMTWTTIATLTNATGNIQFTDPAATNFPWRFYRTVSP